MSEFSDQLKQARLARGLSLHDIARVTKISISLLEALERGDFARLPGGIFSRSFVRAYAIEVGLDPEPTVAAFLAERERAEREAMQALTVPDVTADDRAFLEQQRKAAQVLKIAVIGVAVAVLVLLLWKVRLI